MYNVDEIRYLCEEEGLNDRMIAQKIGCNRTTVTRIRKRNNIGLCNKDNRRDKTYVCVFCGKTAHIKRSEQKRLMCEECLKNSQQISEKMR